MKKTFTLAELFIVLIVMGVMLAISIPNLRRTRNEGDIAKAKGEISALAVAVENYYIHNSNSYPALLNDLTTAIPTIMHFIATDPLSPTSSAYGYNRSGNGKYYVIYSRGIDGNGSASIDDSGIIIETNGASCIYVSNAAEDAQP